jgi:site-specific recombinase XerD
MTLMLGSLSDSTIKQYDVTYKLWWQFCSTKAIDIYNPCKSTILSFLTEQFNENCAYGTLNSHRSALSLLLGNNVGSDDCVKRLLKGAYKQRPSVPKYNHTWDPQIVLNHISHWYPNTSLNLEKITKKLVTLLAVCTAHRVQTLALIKIENIVTSNAGIKIGITDIIKTSAAGREQPVLFLPFFRENVAICPATALRDYIFVTKNKRADSVGNLLLTYRPPHRAATSQSISRWIKQVLSESGIDVAVFTAHSARHAATSAASRAGVSIDTIRRTAGWTTTSTSFARFYNRPISEEGLFARSVCLPTND